MNALDKLIGWVSPQAGANRLRARAQMAVSGAAKRGYDAAKVGRRTDGWTSPSGSANAEIGAALGMMRYRSRELVRNNPYAARAVDILCANIVGTGIIPRVNTGNARMDKRITDLWQSWAETPECDAEGQLDFYGLQRLIARTVEESGECLVRFRIRRPEDSLTIPLQLQVLEPDYLDASQDTAVLPSGGSIEQGIEFDALGRRVAYHLHRAHPGDMLRAQTLGTVRVPASELLHIYRKDRPGQNRGVPRLAPVALKLRDLDEYHEAALVKAKAEACLAAFVTKQDNGETQALGQSETDDSGNRVESFEPGMVAYLNPGENVEFMNPAGGGAFEPFTLQALMAIGVGVGVTYDQLTGDLRQANYSSLRAGKIEFRRLVEQSQWLIMVPMLCAPVWRKVMELAVLTGSLPERKGGYAVEWTPPKHEAIDPIKDTQADIQAVRAGLMTLPQAIARQGWNPQTQIAEIAAANAQLDAAGVVLDTDPRHTTQGGMQQAQQQPGGTPDD